MKIISIVAAAALVVLPAAGATGVPPERFQFDDSFAFDTDCDGVPAHVELTEQGRGMIRHIGTDGMAYFNVNWTGDVDWTNLDTGKSVHLHADFIDQDQRIRDNGDGTITIRVRGHVNEVDYNA